MSEYILRTENLCKNFGALKATDNVNFSIKKGEIRAVIGPNGAGKSTLMDVILNRTPASSGEVYFKDHKITHVPPYKIANLGLYKCFQISQLFPALTVFQNVQIALIKKHGKIFSMLPRKADFLRKEAEEILALVGMDKHMDEQARFLSYGDQRRLEIAITLAMDPELLILDEPTSGVARAEGYELMEMARNLARAKNITIIFIEHDMDIVFKYADQISILDHGCIIATDTPERIHENEFVQQAYVGGKK